MEKIFARKGKIVKNDLKKIVSFLKSGGIIVYPTETAYGIGGDARNEEVIKKIYQIKKRSEKIPLPVIVGSLEQAKKYAKFDSVSLKLAQRYWPGALTLVLNKKKGLPSILTSGKRTVAMRVSGSMIARSIAKELGAPIISTSANDSNRKECYSISAIKRQIPEINKKIGMIIDAGKLPKVEPSTIVKATPNKIVLLRKGSVTF